MPLAIAAAPGFSTTFSAEFCALHANVAFRGIQFFGTCLLTISNSGAAAAESVEVTITAGEMFLYGPRTHVSVPVGGSIPIGISFVRRSNSTAQATGTVKVQWKDPGSTATQTATISLICNVTNA